MPAEEALRLLYRRHSPVLLRIATRVGSLDALTTEDLVHDTWVRATEGFAGFEWPSRLVTWLIGILLNRLREEWRSAAGPDREDIEHVVDLQATEEMLDDRIDLNRAVASPPRGFRTVIVLHDVEGYRHREIAEMLGIDEGTSKSQLSRARLALRRWLEPSRRGQ